MNPETNLAKWWGPHTLTRPVSEETVADIKCVFCGTVPQLGQAVYGIANAVFHYDAEVCLIMKRSER